MSKINDDVTERVKSLMKEGTSLDMNAIMGLATNLLKDVSFGNLGTPEIADPMEQLQEDAAMLPNDQMLRDIQQQLADLQKQYEVLYAMMLKIGKKLRVRNLVVEEDND